MTHAVRTPEEVLQGLPDFPFAAHYRELDGLRLAHLDEGEGSPVIFMHGEPTWSFLWRKVIPPVRDAGFRCLAPDLAGFGRSDKPTDIDWYSYDRHCAVTATLLEDLDLHGATVVVHDWGGPIGLRWAVEHSEQVARLVIMNTGLFAGRVSKGFMAWREFAERTPDMPIGRIMQSATSTELGDEVIAGYEAPFPTPESKAGAQRFPLLVPLSETDPGVSELLAVKDELSRWEKPALVAFSDLDPVFPFPQSGEQFTNLIPSAGEQVRIEGAAHFLQEDRGPQIVEAMLAAFGEPAPSTPAGNAPAATQ